MARPRLTVLQVVPAMHEGGVERGTLEIARALVDAGERSLVISAGGRLTDDLRRDGSEHLTWPIGRKSPATLFLSVRLRRLFDERGVDIVDARSRMPAWIAYLAWRGLRAERRPRFVTTVHGLYSINAYSAVMTRGERVIAVSNTVREYLERGYPRVDPANILVIHRGVDAAEFPFGYRASESWWRRWHETYPELAGKRLILLPGRLSRLKGHDDLLTVIG